MSHFTVLVITEDEPTEDHLTEVLLPFHEYECTGHEAYLQDVDVTEDVMEEFNKVQKVVILADGTYHNRWDDKFYTKAPPVKNSFSRNEFELPEGAREAEISADEARQHSLGYLTIPQVVEEYFGGGVKERDGKWFRRTNPNAKWDWWVRGGRWKGMLLAKRGAMAYAGESGTFGNDVMREGGVDSCRMMDLDLAAMRDDAGKKAAKNWDIVNEAVQGVPFETWDEVRTRYEAANWKLDDARKFYHTQPAVIACKNHERARDLTAWEGPDQFRCGRNVHIQRARDGACQTFAVLVEGKWYTKGEMGWFGAVSDENANWSEEFSKLLDGLTPHMWLTVVDCHI